MGFLDLVRAEENLLKGSGEQLSLFAKGSIPEARMQNVILPERMSGPARGMFELSPSEMRYSTSSSQIPLKGIDGTTPLSGGTKRVSKTTTHYPSANEINNSDQQLNLFDPRSPHYNTGGSVSPINQGSPSIEAPSSVKTRGISDLFGGVEGVAGIGTSAMKYAAAGAAGSMLYGGLHMASPNNGEVNNPISNVFKAGVSGAVFGAALLASHNAEAFATSSTRALNPKWMNWMGDKGAPMVKNLLNNKVSKGALAVGLVAGSGKFDLTRPVNPVYAPNIY